MEKQMFNNNAVTLSKRELSSLNDQYKALHFEERLSLLYQDFDVDKIMVTSSFAATSAYFLHIISSINKEQKIFFIDTGFHFKETLAYKDYLVDLYGLKVESLKADDYQHQYSADNKLYEMDPDFCCTINKVNSLENIKLDYQVWVSSLMSWQTENRASLNIFEERRGILKFNPMIDVSKKDRDDYIKTHNLPFHPLVKEGYASIGCEPCTIKGEDRCGRWNGKPKTECGLHL